MDPTRLYKMKADEAYDGSGDGATDPISTQSLGMYTEIRCRLGDTSTETETETDSGQC